MKGRQEYHKVLQAFYLFFGSNIKYLFKFYTFIEIFTSTILDEFQGNEVMCEHVLLGRSSEHAWT